MQRFSNQTLKEESIAKNKILEYKLLKHGGIEESTENKFLKKKDKYEHLYNEEESEHTRE